MPMCDLSCRSPSYNTVMLMERISKFSLSVLTRERSGCAQGFRKFTPAYVHSPSSSSCGRAATPSPRYASNQIDHDRPGVYKRIIKESTCSIVLSSLSPTATLIDNYPGRNLHQQQPMPDVLYSRPPTSKPSGTVGPGCSSIRSSWLYFDKPQLKSRHVDTTNC